MPALPQLPSMWQPIETFPSEDGHDLKSVLFGRGYVYGDTPEQIAEEEPRIWLLAHTYTHDGKRRFASTETYYTDEVWYVHPTHWMPLPAPPAIADRNAKRQDRETGIGPKDEGSGAEGNRP